jgi:hypothetical protein
MSAHSASQRGGWLSALVAQVSDFVFEDVDETVDRQPVELEPHPVVAVVAAAPRSGATTVARMLAAELATRVEGAASVVAATAPRRSAPPSRAAVRLATGLAGVGDVRPVGRLCVVAPPMPVDAIAAPPADVAPPTPRLDAAAAPQADVAVAPALPTARLAGAVNAARYLAPVVLDLPADGSAAGITTIADRVVVLADASAEPALLDAVADVVGGNPIKVVSRAADPEPWTDRADFVLPESRLGARAATVGTRAIGSLGSAISALADALEAAR